MSYHYAFEASRLLEQCIDEILQLIACDESGRRPLSSSNASLYDIKESLATVEVHLYHFFLLVIDKEGTEASDDEDEDFSSTHYENATARNNSAYFNNNHYNPCIDLHSAVDCLRRMLEERRSCTADDDGAAAAAATSVPHTYYPSRSVADSLLFRLNVALQLCLVRIDDASRVIGGRRRNSSSGGRRSISPQGNNKVGQWQPSPSFRWKRLCIRTLHTTTTLLTLGSCSLLLFPYRQQPPHRIVAGYYRTLTPYQSMLFPVTQVAIGVVSTRLIRRMWGKLWMRVTLSKSAEALEEWARQWSLIIQCSTIHKKPSVSSPSPQNSRMHQQQQQQQQSANKTTSSSASTCRETEDDDTSVDSCRNRRLIEYALHDTSKTSFWQSQGELRFWMIKRAMDVFYASVDTAIGLTHTKPSDDPANWQVPLVTAAAASFYSVTGARDRAATVTSSSQTSKMLIQNAWGMVSLPAVKNLSLQASRLLKGASVADRIEICGVPCFVLSREPAPELAAAIKRNRRMHQRRKPIATLSTIDEEQEQHTPVLPTQRRCHPLPFARSACTSRYRQRDVIFHLTGGGFFAHIIASDLPYLLDWSAKTSAVVICPEYALLPEHTFPYALHQVGDVYRALTSDSAVHTLGFETNRIVVTGESAGGNLAAALCVKLAADHEAEKDIVVPVTKDRMASPNRMPDALMLSCPVLNLSLEVSHSRLVGTEDPVLPSGLISAISDAYLPPELGISKKEPLASPLYAPDAILSRFPPTLLFASSNDPLLDDSVVFNQRLRSLGVDSDLFAANNMPHAYLGLGTAGFPEALLVQEQCVKWLIQQLTRDLKEK